MQVQVLPPQGLDKEVLLVSFACDVMYIASRHAGAGAATSSSSSKGRAAATATAGENAAIVHVL